MTRSSRTTSRREFLAGALGATAGAAVLAPSLGLAAEAAADRFGGMRLGLATYKWGMDWDIPTLIANCDKAGVPGVELRTSLGWAHGVETDLAAGKRREVKKRFSDSPVTLVALACSERMDWPEPERLRQAIEAAKAHLKLSADVGSRSLRVFPNTFHPDVPREKTVAQIARSVNELGEYAAKLGQRVDLEAHGPAGELPTMAAIMKGVTCPVVGVRLNSDKRDAEGQGLEANLKLVRDHLGPTIHLHDLKSEFPYQRMFELLARAGWKGWMLMENSHEVPDRVQAMIEQRQIWEKMVLQALKSRG